MTNSLQVYLDELQALGPVHKNFLTEKWKRLMFLSRKANHSEFVKELTYILNNTSKTINTPLAILEEYYQSSYEKMPVLSKGPLRKDILEIDLRFMEIAHELSAILKLEIVPHRIITEKEKIA